MREVKRTGTLWITANNLYFSADSCKLLLPLHEIMTIACDSSGLAHANSSLIEITTEQGEVHGSLHYFSNWC
jgi:hypothetical protein